MRRKAHKVGDYLIIKGQRGKVTGVNSDGTAIVHALKDGRLLGTAPAYAEMKHAPKQFSVSDIEKSGEDFKVAKDDYDGHDFDAPVVEEDPFKRKQSASRLNGYMEDYWKAVDENDSEDVAVITKAIEYESVVAGADSKLILDGMCGIDGCTYKTKGGFSPSHFALSTCRSGKHNHCTCDSCF
jgi:hypothetical protein